MSRDRVDDGCAVAGIFLAVLFVAGVLVGVAGYVTHIVWTLSWLIPHGVPVTAKMIVVSIIGAVIPPIGSIHGCYLWFAGFGF